MTSFWKATPWINKVILLFSPAVYLFISLEPLLHPAASAAVQELSINSPVGATIFRVQFAGFPIGCAAFLIYCLTSRTRTLMGLISAALLLGSILLVRIYGMDVDASASESMALVIPEAIFTVLTLGGIALEQGYRRRTQDA